MPWTADALNSCVASRLIHPNRLMLALAAALSVIVLSGCSSVSGLNATRNYDDGYALLLPGILGHAPWDNNLAAGLRKGGVPSNIEIYDWTRGPLMAPVNLFDETAKQKHATIIANKIITYQDKYPGRPVYLVGHSGGTRLAVMALEQLPEDRKINGAILLASGIQSKYDLRPAMQHTREGIYNYYSPMDVLISAVSFPKLVTNPQGGMLTAGAVGFTIPNEIAGEDKSRYESKLKQHPYEIAMVKDFNIGDHFGWTNSSFAASSIAPVLLASMPNESSTASQGSSSDSLK